MWTLFSCRWPPRRQHGSLGFPGPSTNGPIIYRFWWSEGPEQAEKLIRAWKQSRHARRFRLRARRNRGADAYDKVCCCSQNCGEKALTSSEKKFPENNVRRYDYQADIA